MKFVLMTYQPILFEIQRRIEVIMVLSGGSQRCQVSVSISNKNETNCQLPFTLLHNEEERGYIQCTPLVR
jgi:hypothetical protein